MLATVQRDALPARCELWKAKIAGSKRLLPMVGKACQISQAFLDDSLVFSSSANRKADSRFGGLLERCCRMVPHPGAAVSMVERTSNDGCPLFLLL